MFIHGGQVCLPACIRYIIIVFILLCFCSLTLLQACTHAIQPVGLRVDVVYMHI